MERSQVRSVYRLDRSEIVRRIDEDGREDGLQDMRYVLFDPQPASTGLPR